MKPQRPRVIAFLRVSTEEQATDDHAGLDRQRDAIARTVAAHNLDVVQEIELVDVSGTNVLLSPVFQQMLRAVENHEVDGVVVADQDRFIRADNLQSLAVLDILKTAKAKLFTSGQVHDYSTDEGILFSHLSAILGGHELRTIKKRTQGAKEVKRKAGECPSAAITLPLGVAYDRKEKHWHYTDDVGAVVEAFRLIDEDGNTNLSNVGKMVGIQNRTLSNLLKNPIYTGWRVYDKKRGDEKYHKADAKQADRKKVARDIPIRVKVIDPPAVSQERFDRVQQILDEKNTKWRRQRDARQINLGTGIAVCAHCGRRLYASSGLRVAGSRQGYYYCANNNYLNRAKGMSCKQTNIPTQIIDLTLIAFAAEHLGSVGFITKLAEKLRCPTEESSAANFTKRIAELEKRKGRILIAYESGAVELDELKRRRTELDKEIESIRLIISSAETRHRIREQADQSLSLLVQACLAFSRITTTTEKQAALRGLFAKVFFDGSKIIGFVPFDSVLRPIIRNEDDGSLDLGEHALRDAGLIRLETPFSLPTSGVELGPVPEGQKRCRICEGCKPLAEFRILKTKNGSWPYYACKACSKKLQKVAHQRRKEKLKGKLTSDDSADFTKSSIPDL